MNFSMYNSFTWITSMTTSQNHQFLKPHKKTNKHQSKKSQNPQCFSRWKKPNSWGPPELGSIFSQVLEPYVPLVRWRPWLGVHRRKGSVWCGWRTEQGRLLGKPIKNLEMWLENIKRWFFLMEEPWRYCWCKVHFFSLHTKKETSSFNPISF